MIFVIIITLLGAYISLGIGTIKKFKLNGIVLSFPMKLLTLLLPFAIFVVHLKMALEVKDHHRAIEIMKMATVHYPVAVGILIEVTLEKFAQKAVFGDSITYIRKKPINISTKTLKKQTNSVFSIYERTTVNLPA